eukprot:988941-Prymnesium_polylepis.1
MMCNALWVMSTTNAEQERSLVLLSGLWYGACTVHLYGTNAAATVRDRMIAAIFAPCPPFRPSWRPRRLLGEVRSVTGENGTDGSFFRALPLAMPMAYSHNVRSPPGKSQDLRA